METEEKSQQIKTNPNSIKGKRRKSLHDSSICTRRPSRRLQDLDEKRQSLFRTLAVKGTCNWKRRISGSKSKSYQIELYIYIYDTNCHPFSLLIGCYRKCTRVFIRRISGTVRMRPPCRSLCILTGDSRYTRNTAVCVHACATQNALASQQFMAHVRTRLIDLL